MIDNNLLLKIIKKHLEYKDDDLIFISSNYRKDYLNRKYFDVYLKHYNSNVSTSISLQEFKKYLRKYKLLKLNDYNNI